MCKYLFSFSIERLSQCHGILSSSYYQWTAFILLGMALLFILPKYIWHGYSRRGGFNIRRLVQMIKEKPDAEKGVEFVKDALKSYIDHLNEMQGSICCGRRWLNLYFGYTATYFCIKILYLINSIVQFFLLNAFLSFNFTGYGVEGISKLFSGEDWFESPRFPRVTMCDFMVRRLGSNQHWYAVQCTLPINIFNDKIFLGVWIWLIILMILNLISLITWSIALTTNQRVGTIKKYLRVMRDVPSKKDRRSSLNRMEDFSDFAHYLHADGFLIFRIVAHNTDEIVAGQIIEHLYRNYPPPPIRRAPMSDV